MGAAVRGVSVTAAAAGNSVCLKLPAYEEYLVCTSPAGYSISLAQCDELLGEPLRLFRFRPGGGDGFMLEEGGNEVAEESLAVGAVT